MSCTLDYDRLLSQEGKRMTGASLAGLVHRFSGVADVVSLAGGLPPPASFPLVRLEAQVAHGGPTLELGQHDQQMYLAQQYNFNPQGHPPLLNWLKQLTDALHPHPPHTHSPAPEPAAQSAAPIAAAAAARGVTLTSGAINAIAAAIAVLADAGDTLLCDEYTYTHALECVFLPRGLRCLPVRGDGEGMLPADMERQIGAAAAAGLPRPRLLYVIPTGQNPTGVVMSQERKRQLYELACRHDLLILEDDAYYCLHYPAITAPAATLLAAQELPPPSPGGCSGGTLHAQTTATATASQAAPGGLRDLPSSFLSMDVAGRVLRIDTLSKVLGPGYRLGWVSGPQALVSKISLWAMATSVGPASMTQVVVSQLLERWGMDGFGAHVARLQQLYGESAAAAHAAATAHLAGLAEWIPAQAGMFMWFKLTGLPDFSPELLEAMVRERVVVVPGRMFRVPDAARGQAWPSGGSSNQTSSSAPATAAGLGADGDDGPCPYFRLSFASTNGAEGLEEGFRRLAAAIRATMERQASAAR